MDDKEHRYIVRVLTAEFWNPLPIHVQTTRHLEFKSISPRHIWSDINPMHCYASIFSKTFLLNLKKKQQYRFKNNSLIDYFGFKTPYFIAIPY